MSDAHHASCVALNGKAALLTGKSGSGKSALALQLIALGCGLVADDRTILTRQGDQLVATCPSTIAGLIEARGIGILNVVPVASAQVVLMVDLDQLEAARLPQRRFITVLGCDLPLIWRIDHAHFVPAIFQILTSGWSDR